MVTTGLRNPFDIVKATDLTDGQIADYFVDFPDEGATLLERINPRSRMPMFLFGGKGSGKTHLMRYLSYPLQLYRQGTHEQIRRSLDHDRYLGLYFRCSGLNAQRFAGKRQTDDVWMTVFAYYMELWIGQLVVGTVLDLFKDTETLSRRDLVEGASNLLDIAPPDTVVTMEDFLRYLEQLQRSADVAINNCALSGALDIKIQATAGRVIFGLPQLFARLVPELHDVLFLYLVDEFENLTLNQQRYVQTLLRERQGPCTFKVGVRLYGLRTFQTLSAAEENREDSEYEVLRLDSELRDRPESAQLDFATRLVRRRLREAGYFPATVVDTLELPAWFDERDSDKVLHEEVLKYSSKYRGAEPPYIETLRRKLAQGIEAGSALGLRSVKDVERLIAMIRVPNNALLERTNLFLLYRAWSKNQNLTEATAKIAEDATRTTRGDKDTLQLDLLTHWRADIVAQLLRETKQALRYAGFATFVDLSAGLPRGLLTILKHVFTWSQFYGEAPFKEGQISLRAQMEGVSQASEWFFNEARAPGIIGTQVRAAMTRLGQLLRDMRFSDKPSECSLSCFTVDPSRVSEEAKQVLQAANDWSMLIRVTGGGVDRNQARVDDKYQIHPMLAPRWNLPISRRGAVALNGDEINAIFAPAQPSDFDAIVERRVGLMTAPNFGRRRGTQTSLLPGFEDG